MQNLFLGNYLPLIINICAIIDLWDLVEEKDWKRDPAYKNGLHYGHTSNIIL